MNRGSSSIPAELHDQLERFNEAPIHESGKWLVVVAVVGDDLASMRPRFMNRGSASTVRFMSVR